MRNIIFAGLALTALAAVPAAAAPASPLPPEAPAVPALLLESSSTALAGLANASQGRVQVWLDGSRDVYRPGERIRARVRSDRDGYLAVFHIDTNGDVDVIYPYSEHEDGWIEAGRTMSLGSRGGYEYVRSRGGYGMGYIMAVTLDEPLELYRVRELYGVRTAGWDGNRSVFGDPFYAMDELVRAIVPQNSFGYEAVDYATYHVGRRYNYPRYACYDSYGPWYHHRGVYWDDCDRVRILLVSYPWYYDTHRWRGSRRVYYERYYYPRTAARNRPLHGYKERTDGQAPPARDSRNARRPEPRPANGGGSGTYDRPGSSSRDGGTARRPEPRRVGGSGGYDRPSGPSDQGTDGSAPATRQRPERVGTDGSTVRGGPAERRTRPVQQDGAEPRQQDRPVQPDRERPTFQRRRESEGSTRSAEPRREAPQRSAERPRESQPSRSAEPRRESPPARSAEPRRESRPPSSSSSGGSRSSGSGDGGSSAPRSRPPRG